MFVVFLILWYMTFNFFNLYITHLCMCWNVASIPVISEQEARDCLIQYCTKKCCYGKGAAERMTIRTMQSTSAFHVWSHLSSHTHTHQPSEFNVLTSLLRSSDLLTQVEFAGAQEHFWPLLSISCRHQWHVWVPAGVEARFAECMSVAITTKLQLAAAFISHRAYDIRSQC